MRLEQERLETGLETGLVTEDSLLRRVRSAPAEPGKRLSLNDILYATNGVDQGVAVLYATGTG